MPAFGLNVMTIHVSTDGTKWTKQQEWLVSLNSGIQGIPSTCRWLCQYIREGSVWGTYHEMGFCLAAEQKGICGRTSKSFTATWAIGEVDVEGYVGSCYSEYSLGWKWTHCRRRIFIHAQEFLVALQGTLRSVWTEALVITKQWSAAARRRFCDISLNFLNRIHGYSMERLPALESAFSRWRLWKY